MTEKIYTTKKNGMIALLLTILGLLAGIALIIFGAVALEHDSSTAGTVMLVLGIVIECLGWIPLMGLKVIKPQEALVLTLFGNY